VNRDVLQTGGTVFTSVSTDSCFLAVTRYLRIGRQVFDNQNNTYTPAH